ncbi:MAG: HYR domain-containing protein, partial [Bacteroidales bacterium]|nr:HYR domain-containing protein [Bacteroidales bacterium]
MGTILHSVNRQKFSAAVIARGVAAISVFIVMLLSVQQTKAQATLQAGGATSVCAGESTSINVVICGGYAPWTVVYTDGTNNYTVTGYDSNCDPDTGPLEGDPIIVTPAVTTTYTLVSVSFGDPLVGLSLLEGSVTITVNPLPSSVVVAPSTRQCPGVNFTISATATNGSNFELWNAANTVKIADLPYLTSISANTNYTVRAISNTTPACTTSVAYTVLLENTPPSITCPGNQTLNPNPATGCSAALPDYRSLATVSDNCTAAGSITISQSPAPGTSISGHNTTQQITLTATDAAGNQASCNFNVTLLDNVNPTISCVSNQIVPAGAGCTYTHSGTAWNPSGADNCTVASVTFSANNGASPASGTSLNGVVFQPGTTTVTWTVTDGAGNTGNCSFDVSIEDTEDPSITFCPGNQTAATNSGLCSYTHSGTAWNVTASDNCTVASIVYTLSGATTGTINTTLNGAVFNSGITTVSVLVSDGASPANTTSCSFTVTVTDDDVPTVTCPANIAVDTDASECTAAVTIPAITFGDNCSSPVLTWSTTGATNINGNGQPSTQTFNAGVTTVTLTVTDGALLTATCSFTVTVTDNEDPSVTCPGNLTANNASGTCSASVTIPVVSFDDNCSGSSLSWSTSGATSLSGNGQPGAQTFNSGVTTVLLTVTDASLNTASCSFTVTVSDTEDPSVTCPGNITASNAVNQCSASVTIPAIVFGDNCSGSVLSWSTSGATTLSGNGQPGAQTFNVGTTTVTLTVTDGDNNTATCSFTVTVNDTQAPVISGCPANITRTAGAGSCTAAVSWTEPTATDNCTPSGSLVWTKSHTPGTVFSVGTTTVTYTATDGAGNVSATCSFTVTINDLVKPVISNCPSNISVGTGAGATTCNAVVSWTEPTATDNCSAQGNLVWTKSHLPGSTFPVGTTTVTYTVQDESGNVSNPCIFNVTVTDNTPPVAVCKNATLTLNGSGQATLIASQVNNGSSDNCTASGSLILTLSKTSFNCSNIGANTVILTVRDASGNISTCSSTVTVVDNLAPTISATPTTVNSSRNTTSGFCYYTVVGTEFDPTTTDNCSGATLSYSVSGATTLSGTGSLAGKNLNVGANVITWTATDASGNTSSPAFSFTITINDNQGPVIVGIGNQNRGTQSNACGYTVSGTEFDPTVTDNCSGNTTLSWSVTGATTATGTNTLNGVFMNKGVNVITWTATDGTNNSTSTFRLTVNDDDAPYIEQLPDITVDISIGCGAVVSWTEPLHSDNCPGLIFSQVNGIESGEEFPVGTTMVRYRALDAAGNQVFMSFNVIVNDLTPPTITCPAGSPFARNTDNGFCFYTVQGAEFNPITSDGCPVTAINSFDSTNTLTNKLLPAGTHTIEWTVTDSSNNTSSCTIVVVVTDNQNPTFNQPAVGPHSKGTDPGQCYYTIPDITYDVTNVLDNCSVNPAAFIITNNGSTFLTGTNSLAGVQLPKSAFPYIITWTVTDVNGNITTAIPVTISVSDNQMPQFICHGNEIRTAPGGGCSYTIVGTEFDPSSLSDNCDDSGDLELEYFINGVSGGASTTMAGNVLNAGANTIVWTITDGASNTNTCTFVVTVNDVVAPSFTSTIGDQTRNAPAGVCYYTASGTEFDPAVTDNCPDPVLINNQNASNTLSGFEFPVGITVVVWTLSDASGNTVTQQFEVEVLDVTAPTYDLTANTTRDASSGNCSYMVSGTEFDPQLVDDNCTEDNLYIRNNYNNYRSLNYAVFPVGTTEVIWTVRDFYGNTNTQTMNITVVDNTDPVINCPVNYYVRVVDDGQNYYTVGAGEFRPVATDNCAVASYLNDYNSSGTLTGEQLPVGTTNITWTATDASGNTTTCTLSVIVVSELYPPITCVGDQSVNNTNGDCSYTVSGPGFNATSTSPLASLTHNVQTSNSGAIPYAPGNTTLNGAIFPVGTTLVTWTATQEINGTTYTNTCSFYVTVVDDEDPLIQAPADINTTTNSGCFAYGVSLGTPVTSDNCGIYTTWNNVGNYYSYWGFPIGSTTITWYTEDIHGNISSDNQIITVTDDDAPALSCPGSLCRQQDYNQTYYTVRDHEFDPYYIYECSGIQSRTYSFNGGPAVTANTLAGVQVPNTVTTITWTITDNAGNSSSCTINIDIRSSDPPPVTCRGNQYRNTDSNVCSYTVQGSEFDVSSTQSSPAVTLTHNIQTTDPGTLPYAPSSTTLANAVFPGDATTTVIWTATEGSNMNECCTYTVTVEDNQVPSVTWPENLTVNVNSGSCQATGVSVGSPVLSDNCTASGSISATRSPSGTTFDIGTTNVYWTVHDGNGNYIYHTQTVTVVDNIAPTINCPATTYYREYDNLEVNYYTVLGDEFEPTPSDNCEIQSYINNLNGSSTLNGTQLGIGDHAITWTATDLSGNTATCVVNITIVDSFDPLLDCPGNASFNTGAANCDYTIGNDALNPEWENEAIISGRTLTHDVQTANSSLRPYALSNSTLNGAVFATGTTTVTWTASQTIGGVTYTDDCVYSVTVVDAEAPVMDLPFDDVTFNVDPGECYSSQTPDFPTATDNCTPSGSITISNDLALVMPFDIGPNNVRWTFTDASGNTAIHTQVVTVVDNEGPVITNCPVADITAVSQGEDCTAIVSWPNLIATDDCSGVKSFTSTHSPGQLFPVGTTVVTYTATDNADNVSTCVFNVVVTDTPPSITCVGDKTRNANSGTCAYVGLGNEFDPVNFDDNCSAPSVTWSYTDPETLNLVTGSNSLSGVSINRGFNNGPGTGVIPITWTATDENGNFATCSFTLTILDVEGPVITVPGNQTRPTDLHQNYYTVQGTEFDDVIAVDNCGIVTKLENIYGGTSFAGQILQMGENELIWTAEDDSDNESSASFFVYIIDTEAPRVFTLPQNITASVPSGCSMAMNYTPPVIVDNVTTNLTLTYTPDYAVPGYIFPVGVTPVTISTVDEAGNAFSYTFNITVLDEIAPTLDCPVGDPGNLFTRSTDPGEPYYTAINVEFNPTAYGDNCDFELTNDWNNSTTLTGEQFEIGTHEVIWTVTDSSNNVTSCTIIIEIEDNEDPTIENCPPETVAKNSDPGECYYTVPGSEYDPYGFDDNDDVWKLTYQINSGSEVGLDLLTSLVGVELPVGTDVITWRLYDMSGNVNATCVTTFTITDPEPPVVLTVGTQTRSTDAGQNYYTSNPLTDAAWDPVITDNCEVDVITYTIDGGTPVGIDETTSIMGVQFGIGTHTVVWSATDIHGNGPVTGSYQVIITDDENPTAVCNPVTIDLDATGNYTLDEDDIAAIGAGSNDPGGPVTLSVSPESFDCADTGTNTVTLTVTDGSGNTATCNAEVTVQDVTPPTATCTSATLTLDALGQAVLNPASLNAGSADACGIAGYAASQTIFDCSDVGNHTITLTVTDNNGNTSTCDASVTIVDNTAPNAVCNPITVSLDATGNWVLTQDDLNAISAGSADNCASTLTVTVTPNTFDCSDIGANSATVRVTDPGGQFDECTTTITVEDNLPPVARCQNITVNLDATGNAVIAATDIDNGSTDNCDASPALSIDVSSFTCADLGSNTVTLTVTDDNGNSSTCTSTVTIADDIDPEVTCPVSNQTVGTDTDVCTYTHSGTSWDASATDGCTTIASLTYTLSGVTTGTGTSLDGVIFNRGVTTVTWTATDGSGNTGNCFYTVTVNDNQNPDAVCQNITVQLDAGGSAAIVAADVNNGSDDNCGIQSLAVSPNSFDCDDLGANTVTLTVTDLSGNTSTCEATVTVEDNIDPVAACTPITISLEADGDYTLSVANINAISAGSSDNCDIATRVVSPNTFDCSDIGSNSVELTITDDAGNTSTCTTTVTVEDNTDPSAVCQDITVQLNSSGSATITANDIDDGSTDACGIASLVASQTSFDCLDLGNNTVTLTVTDNNGNVSTCTSTVTVQDLIAPSFGATCPGNQSVTTDPGVCTYTHSGVSWNPSATDNCTLSALTYSANNGALPATGVSLNNTVFQNGVTTVTWTATDQSGNSQTCVFTVTVTDDEDPLANCQAYTAPLLRNGEAVVTPANIDNLSSDNCGIVTYEISKTGGAGTWASSITYTCSDIGTPTSYLRVTDAAGRTATCSSTITVVDQQAPTLDDLTDRLEVTDNGVCTYTHNDNLWNPTDNCDSSPTITYTLSGATTVVTPPNTTLNGQVFNQGTTTVTWTVADHATVPNTATVTFDVVVTDNQNPVVNCPSNITQNVGNPGDLSVVVSGIPDAVYSDNCAVTQLTYALSGATTSAHQGGGINQLNSATFNVGTTTVTYIAYDAAGNSHTCTFTVTVNALPSGAVTVTGGPVETYENQAQGPDSFTVVLPAAPTGDVCIIATSSDNTEAIVDTDNTRPGAATTKTICFDETNWDIPQTIYVFGVDDLVDDDDIAYNIVLSIDPVNTDEGSGYYNANPDDVAGTNIDNDVAGITVTPVDSQTTETGQTGTFTVVLDTEPTETVTITLSSDDLTEGDVTSATTLTFTPANWNVAQTVTVTGIDEFIVDGDVAYDIVTSAASSADLKYNNMVVDDVTMTNIDNDVAGFIVTPTSLTVSENATTATFTIVLTSMPATDDDNYVVVVNVASNNTAEGTVDISQLTFDHDDWNIPQTITVTGVDDIVVDGTIAFTIVNTVDAGLTTDPNYDPLNPADVSVNNTDNDAATVAINDVTVTEGSTVPGTTAVNFTLTHSGAQVIGGYGVTWFTQNTGTAKAPSDFTGTGGTVTFLESEAINNGTKTVTVLVNQDIMVEPNETFPVRLGIITGASGKNITISDNSGTGTITNDDSSVLAINDVSITEGNAGTSLLTFTVSLSNAVELGVTVDYNTSDGTAADADNDYEPASGTLTFVGTQGETQTFSVTINGDLKVELDETFTATLSNVLVAGVANPNVTISDGTGIGTIENDDAATLVITGFTVNENAGTANYTVTLSGAVQTPFTVDFATSDITALAGSDYEAVNSTLTFGGANPLVQTISIPITDDIFDEPTETLRGTISNLSSGGQDVTITTATATGTINDNDNASLAINNVSVDESAGTATFTVTLTGNTQDAISVNFATANNTALSASDYSSNSGTVTFNAGSLDGATQTITINITSDAICEPTETYFINLSGLVTTGNATIADNQGLGTITDDDSATLTITGFEVTETNGTQTANFVVSMTAEAQENVVLSFGTANVTAVSGSDYTAQTGTVVTLTGGNTSVNVPLSVLGDLIAEPTETLTGTIAITNVNGQQITIATPTATSTINDNDIITIDLAGFTVTETEATQVRNFRASMNTTAQEDIILEFSTANGTALSGSDYTARTAISVTILAGTLFTDIPVDILGDTYIEPTEAFTGTITLTEDNGQQATVGALTGTATGTIIDDDVASIAIADVSVDEDAATALFTVTLTGDVQDAFSVDFATSNNTALAGSDYTTTTGTLNFSAGSLSGATRTFTVDISDDTYTEPTETYTLTLSNITGGLVTISDAVAVGTIVDNDAVTFTIDDITVAENVGSGVAVFTVTMSGDNLQDELTMSFASSDGSSLHPATPAEEPSDYLEALGTLTFEAGSLSGTTKTITVTIVNNAIAEPLSEYYEITLSNISTTGTASFTDALGLGEITDDDPLNSINLVGFTESELDVNTTYNFVASLDYIAQEPVVISFTTTQGTALHGSDLTQQTTVEYTFPPLTLSINIPVVVVGDLVVEPTEAFTGTIALVNANGQQISIGSTPTATGTINDNDQATLTISGFTANEGDGTGSFTVTSDRVIQNAVTVDFATSNGTALTGSDYTAFSTTLDFGNGEALSQTVPITILEDLIVEPTETLTGTLSNLQINSQDVILNGGGATTTATSYIEDNDAATLSINDVTNTEPDNGETLEYVFIITHSGRSTDGPFTVAYQTAEVSAAGGSDYVTTSGTVTFSGTTGEIKMLTVVVNGDLVVEPTETFTVGLTEDDFGLRNITFTDDTGLGTILNDDATSVSVVASDAAAAEPDNDGEYTVSMGLTSSTNTVISYTISGDAVAGSDYTALSGTVTIPAGSTSATIPVPVIDDSILEDDETVTITLSAVTSGNSGISIGAPYIASVVISDDDVATVSITATDAAAAEPDNDGEFTISISNAADVATVITYAITGSATPGSDYTTLTGTATIPAGSTSVTIPVEVIDNLIMESSETVIVTLTAITSGDANTSIDTDNDVATVTIADNDVATVSIAASDPTASEPSNDGEFTVTMSQASDTDTEISYTIGGTATAGSDYNTLSGTVIILAGSTTATIDVLVNDDAILENTETVTVTLASITSGNSNISIGLPDEATVNINDNDAASLSIADVTISEADGTATFTVTLTGAVQGGVSIDYATANNTAVAGSDYSGTSGILTFAGTNGETETFTVDITDNSIVEITETFFINLSDISNALVTYDALATGTITDDDAATLSINSVSQNEGNSGTTNFTFTVSMSAASDAAVTVNYATANGTATTGDSDYITASGTLTFAAGDTEETFSVTVNGDTRIEDDEIFTVALSNLVNNGRNISLNTSTGTGTILNDDNATITINDVSIVEGNAGTSNLSFTVTMSGSASGTVTVDYATADNTATIADGDYISVAGTLVFTAGQTSRTIIVPINGDTKVEDNETFYMNLSNLSNGGLAVTLSDSQGVGTITNDDAAAITINDVTTSEGNSGTTTYTFTVSMSAASDDAVTVDYSTADGSATIADGDYDLSTGTLTFAAGETTKTITVTINGDTKVENNETFTVVLSNLENNGNNVSITDATGTGTITNDDSATLSIDDVTLAEGDSGTTSFSFTVILSAASDAAVTVDYTTANGTATTADSDYSTATGTLAFAAGETSKTITVSVNGDTRVEDDETFTVELSNLVTNGRPITLTDASGLGTITNDDNAPVLDDITKSGTEDQTITFAESDFTNAFNDADGDDLVTVEVVSLPANGDLYLNSVLVTTGQLIPLADLDLLTFVPDGNWFGTTTFDYNASDGTNWATLDAQVIITINSSNDAPVAVNDEVTTPEDTSVAGTVLTNDSDPENDVLTVTQFVIGSTTYLAGVTATIPGVGTLVINSNGSFQFVPVLNYNGSVPAATYTITDGNGGFDTADLLITVTAVNDPPVLVDDAYTLCSSTTSSGNILTNGDADPDGTALTVNTVPLTDALHGTFTIESDGDYTYDPDNGYNGTDFVVVEICDSGVPGIECANSTITFTVNQAVTAAAGADQSLCDVTTATLAGNDPSPGTGLWTLISGPNVPAITTPSAYNSTVTGMIPGTYVLRWTINNGVCASTSDDVSLINYDSPTTASAGSDQEVCGLEATLAGNTATSGTGTWTQTDGPIGG